MQTTQSPNEDNPRTNENNTIKLITPENHLKTRY